MRRKFLRQNWHRHKRLGMKWRKPKGKQSKMRIDKKGRQARVKIGYKHAEGKVTFIAKNIADILIAKSAGFDEILIFSGLGARKAGILAAEAEKTGVKILNRKKIRYAIKINAAIKKKQEEKKTKESEKKKPADKKKEEKKEME